MPEGKTRAFADFIWPALFFLLTCSSSFTVLGTEASAEEPSQGMSLLSNDESAPPPGEYHTPLAGEPFHTVFMGRVIDIPRRDRGTDTALNLGVTLYLPGQADSDVLPIFAFYLKRIREEYRLRVIASGVYNDAEASRRWGNFELLGRFENYTNPFGQTGIQDNKEVKGSSVEWGTLSGYLGAGLRFPVSPYQIDNELRLQLYGRLGYLYSKSTSDTDPGVRLPPDTPFYGVTLRGRYDGFRRNLIELPHTGSAAGFDVEAVHRDRWSDSGNRVITFSEEDSQDYLKLSAYVMGITGIPGLSEKNKIFATLHGGLSNENGVDRYNAFQLESGPIRTESDDLYRLDYPGALYHATFLSKYVLATLEYRRELTFFMYLHLKGTFIWADRESIVAGNQIGFVSKTGQAASIGLTTGFFWNSQIYIEYAWDTGFLRDGTEGSTVQILWSKSL